uniref:Uncharacterized protein n=1 Tax=Rhizophora mucronata TaxID=61149 RepID=A0A2P2PPC6_RHIMU
MFGTRNTVSWYNNKINCGLQKQGQGLESTKEELLWRSRAIFWVYISSW